MPSHKHPELARKIAAAVVSYIVGAKSMDHFLEQNVPESVAPIWHELAEGVMEALSLGEERVVIDIKRRNEKLRRIKSDCLTACCLASKRVSSGPQLRREHREDVPLAATKHGT